MGIRIHSVEENPDSSLHVTGDTTDADRLERIDLSQGGSVILSETKFNPNFSEPTPPTRPRSNHFVLDIPRESAASLKGGNVHVAAIGSGVRQSVNISDHLSNATREPYQEPDFDKVLCDPSEVDRQVETDTSRRPRTIYPFVKALLDGGVLNPHSPDDTAILTRIPRMTPRF